MPNNWLDEKPNDTGWLDKTPLEDTGVKTLKDINDERQKVSETPITSPAPLPAPEPIEDIPYQELVSTLVSAAKDVLAGYSKLGAASNSLNKNTIIVSTGPKGKDIISKSKEFQLKVDTICSELKKVSEDLVAYKNTLQESVPTSSTAD